MKKAFIVTAAFFLLFAVTDLSGADSNIIDSMDFQDKGVELTLDEVINIVQEDNPTIEMQELSLEKAIVEYDQAKYNLRKLKPLYEGKREDSADYLQNYKLLEVSSQFTKENAERNLAAAVENVNSQAEEAYFNLLQAEEMLDVNEENAALGQSLYDQSLRKFELGLITKQELINSELNLINAQNSYQESEDLLKKMKMSFNITIGHEVMDDIKLKDELTKKEFREINIAETVSQALLNRNEVKAAEFGYEIAKINFDITSKLYPDITFQYREKAVSLQEAEKNLETINKQIEMEVRSNYLDVKQKEAAIEAYEQTVILAEEALKINSMLYETGMAMVTDVIQAQNSLQQAKIGLSKAILDYNMAVLKFEDSIGVGRTVLSN